MMKELTAEEITRIKNAPVKARNEHNVQYTVPGTNVRKSKKVDTSVRNIQTWLRLPHSLSETCAFSGEGEHRAMVAKVDNVYMCRYCFLEGK